MKLDKVTISYSRKINLGDFNSADFSCMLTAHIEPGDDTDKVMRDLWTMARANIRAVATDVTKKDGGVTYRQTFMGLPIEEETNAD